MASPETIYALSSGRLPAGVAVVRVSGPHAPGMCRSLCGVLPSPRRATLTSIKHKDGSLIDRALVIFFPAPHSSTGEDLVEFHLHGGRAVVSALYAALSTCPEARPAEPGEFTFRAFLNGKMDLLQAEAVADLVEAETETQRRLALANAGGLQTALYVDWRNRLLHAQAMAEAELDFADEDDVPGSIADQVWKDMQSLAAEMRRHCADYSRAETIRDGFDVVIAGPPNAGKSSLFNALLRRDAAIVSPEPGTTRDLVEAVLELDGVKVRLTDTAGIREQPGIVEAMGIEKARQRIESADLVLAVVDLSTTGATDVVASDKHLRVGTKADAACTCTVVDIETSAATGAGIEELLSEIARQADAAAGTPLTAIPSRMRHVEEVSRAASALDWATEHSDAALEIRVEALRSASRALSKLIGTIETEDVLGAIFSRFCIGK